MGSPLKEAADRALELLETKTPHQLAVELVAMQDLLFDLRKGAEIHLHNCTVCKNEEGIANWTSKLERIDAALAGKLPSGPSASPLLDRIDQLAGLLIEAVKGSPIPPDFYFRCLAAGVNVGRDGYLHLDGSIEKNTEKECLQLPSISFAIEGTEQNHKEFSIGELVFLNSGSLALEVVDVRRPFANLVEYLCRWRSLDGITREHWFIHEALSRTQCAEWAKENSVILGWQYAHIVKDEILSAAPNPFGKGEV